MNPHLCQNCAVVDPNTDFEFNLQALASEKGYTTTANGKDFLVRRMLSVVVIFVRKVSFICAFSQTCR